MPKTKKLALLVNVIAPYRAAVYEAIGKQLDLTVLHGGSEPNRLWDVKLPQRILTHKVFTLKFSLRRRLSVEGLKDTSYIHLNLGLLYWLPLVQPDIIISNEMGMRSWIALVYGYIFRKPVWIWWGGTMHSERNLGFIKKWNRKLFALVCKRWISYGISSTRYLMSLDISNDNILQIQNCVSAINFTSKVGSIAFINEKVRPVLLTVGQLIDRKGIDRLIQSCRRMQAEGLDFTLMIVGSGPGRDTLFALAHEIGLKHFVFLPEQTQETLNAVYRSADVFIFPTLEDVWGLVVNEAILCGTPVLCSCYAGCAEELISAENIFDPLSNTSIDEALRRALKLKVPPAPLDSLWSCEEVADSIVSSITINLPMNHRHAVSL